MIPNPFGRRRAQRFAQLLDEAEGAPRHHVRSAYDEELGELVAVARASTTKLSTVADQVTVDPVYRRRMRQRLLAVGNTQGIGDGAESVAEAEPAVGPRRRLKLAVAVGATSGVLALSGVSTASGDAVPGDALYAVKRQTERAQVALAGSEVNRGQLYLGFARTRLHEARAVASDPDALDDTLDDMDSDVRRGTRLLNTAAVDRRDQALLTTVGEFVTDHRRKVVDLVNALEDDSRSRVRALESLELLHQAAERAVGLRRGLMCTSDAAGYADSLGPVPQRCSALPTPDGDAGDGSGTATRDGRTSDMPSRSSRPSAEKSSPGLLPDPTDGLGRDDQPSKSPGDGILDDLGRLLDDLFGK